MNKKVIIPVIVLILVILVSLVIVTIVLRPKPLNVEPITLEYWGVHESAGDIAKLVQPYSTRHPLININYRRIAPGIYEDELIKAWSLGNGPDLFMLPITKLRQYLPHVTPMPQTMNIPVEYETGTLKKEKQREIRIYNGYSNKQVEDLFITTVSRDVVISNQIYGLPYRIDSLSVFYNEDLLIENNIALPAGDWQELLDQSAQISRIDENDNIVQSTIALGTTHNIPGVFDILSTLMLQTGVELEQLSGSQTLSNDGILNAIQFYLSFAQPGNQNYSWNENMPDALDAFTAGKLAYFIGYPYHGELIQQINPRLNFDIMPMLKPAGVDQASLHANYWVSVVHKPICDCINETNKVAAAWHYIMDSTAKNNVSTFLASDPSNKKITALRSLVAEQQNDERLEAFTKDILRAKNWYRGYDFDLAEKYFIDMINTVQGAYVNNTDLSQPVTTGLDLISQTYSSP